MAAPTFVAEYEVSSWSTTTSPKTVSVTTAVGDVLVLIGLEENRLGVLATPTGGTGLTWTLQQEVTATPTSDWCAAYVWTAVATTAETFTLSVARSGTAVAWGWICLRWSGSDGVGASSKTNVSGGAPSLGLTTTAANSAICVGNSDWNAIDGASRTWRTVNGAAATEQSYFRSGTTYAAYSGRHNDAGAAGAQTVGLSAPAGQKYSIVAVEVLGTSGGSPQTVTPTGIAIGAALGSPTVTTATTASPTGVATGAATGTPTVSTSTAVSPSGIATGGVTGSPSVSTAVTVSPTGIPPVGAVGTPVLSTAITAVPSGVPTGAALGTPGIVSSVTVSPTGIASSAQVGTPTITGGAGGDPERNLPWTLILNAPQRAVVLTPIPVRELTVSTPIRTAELTTPIRTLEISMTNTVKFGDTHSIELTVYGGDPPLPVDLTGTSVRLLAKSGESATVELDATLDADPTTGKVHHTLTGTLPVGTYDVEVEDTVGSIKTTSPTIGYISLIVAQDLG